MLSFQFPTQKVAIAKKYQLSCHIFPSCMTVAILFDTSSASEIADEGPSLRCTLDKEQGLAFHCRSIDQRLLKRGAPLYCSYRWKPQFNKRITEFFPFSGNFADQFPQCSVKTRKGPRFFKAILEDQYADCTNSESICGHSVAAVQLQAIENQTHI